MPPEATIYGDIYGFTTPCHIQAYFKLQKCVFAITDRVVFHDKFMPCCHCHSILRDKKKGNSQDES